MGATSVIEDVSLAISMINVEFNKMIFIKGIN